ncbi:hypothetical protein G9A89_020095 [Geosiphon pyriformis]|nr:hypothetical protein G9A89_020095 [Geosiphon pyriformis]
MNDQLPCETLQQILSYLAGAKDSNSLFSCLLVNRAWCVNATSVLWRRPFELCPTDASRAVLVQRCLSLLPKEVKVKLGLLGANIKTNEPKFDYPAFLRELSLVDLFRAVSEYYKRLGQGKAKFQDSKSQDENLFLTTEEELQCYAIVEELTKLFFARCEAFEYFALETNEDCGGFDPETLEDIIPKLITIALSKLKHLRILKISGATFNKLGNLQKLSATCRNLEKLILILDYNINFCEHSYQDKVAKQVTKLMTVQNHLKHFAVLAGKCPDFSQNLWLAHIMLPLKGQASTLSIIELDAGEFPDETDLTGLDSCENLETIILNKIHSVPPNFFNALEGANFPKLKIFHVGGSPPHFPDLMPAHLFNSAAQLGCLIQNAKESLQQVWLPIMDLRFFDGIFNALLYCQNLTHLQVVIDRGQDLAHLSEILEVFNKMEWLQIRGHYEKLFFGDDKKIAPQLMADLGRRMPTTLRHLDIQAEWEYDVTIFKRFLEELRVLPKYLRVTAMNGVRTAMNFHEAIKDCAASHQREIVRAGSDVEEIGCWKPYAYCSLE